MSTFIGQQFNVRLTVWLFWLPYEWLTESLGNWGTVIKDLGIWRRIKSKEMKIYVNLIDLPMNFFISIKSVQLN